MLAGLLEYGPGITGSPRKRVTSKPAIDFFSFSFICSPTVQTFKSTLSVKQLDIRIFSLAVAVFLFWKQQERVHCSAKCYMLYYLFMLSVYTNNSCSLVPGDILPWHHFGSDMEASFNRRKVQLQNDKQIFRNQQKATIYHVKILVIQACNM